MKKRLTKIMALSQIACSVILYTACIALKPSVCKAQQTGFFRVLTSNDQVDLHLSPDAVLDWSAPPGYFLVERSTDLSFTNWAPWARGTSSVSAVSLKVDDFRAPQDMVYIPAGYFKMGDIFNDTPGLGKPVHDVYVSGFYVSKFEVTNQKMAEALNWAYSNAEIMITNIVSTNSGVLLTNLGIVNIKGTTRPLMLLQLYDSVISFSNQQFIITSGRERDPAIYLTWYGCVAYCNYRSMLEGLPVCYDLTNWTCDFNQTGYRLPTEAEWEKAARGGWEGYRFPWINTSNTITHSEANYRSSTNNYYDVSLTRDYNPAAGTVQPYTTPVGYFAPNGYGLYDMAGNNWEFCWDWAGNYPSTTVFDPTGPATGTSRIFRGGSWRTTAERVTCGMRYTSFPPANAFDDIGLRVVRSYKPPLGLQ